MKEKINKMKFFKKIIYKTKWPFYIIFSTIIELFISGGLIWSSLFFEKNGHNIIAEFMNIFVYMSFGCAFFYLNYKKERINAEQKEKEKLYQIKNISTIKQIEIEKGIDYEKVEKEING